MAKWIQMASVVSLILLLSACVTINIYFPAAAAKKAADRIIDDVWQLKPHTPVKSVPPASPQSSSGQ
ncbi:MAG: hypothetical protein KGI54_09970 [Pseudomonadota bacterium]|nr:hypothetical protein [Pseudomonadota bacterium]